MGALWSTIKFKNTFGSCRKHKTIDSYPKHSLSEQAFCCSPQNFEFEEAIKKCKKDKALIEKSSLEQPHIQECFWVIMSAIDVPLILL
jgi:hypothetical protein